LPAILKSALPIIFLICVAISLKANASRTFSIIPKPVIVEKNSGFFSFPQRLVITSTGQSSVAQYLKNRFEIIHDSKIEIASEVSAQDTFIQLQILENPDTILATEGYKLIIANKHVQIKANHAAGIFYGIQTLLQLMPPSIFGEQQLARDQINIPCAVITDYPRFQWRGMHLDVSRHFFPVEFIKKYIDLIALHKINVFHWHLTDDQGWRIEIRQYPELIKTGAWRKEKDGTVYGGYYTQDEIREVVEYARQRFVTIVPEIEMPGHSSAAIASYPWLGCTGQRIEVSGKWGIRNDIYCPKEETFEFLENVLDEVTALFPGDYIHIGGDEAPKYQWKKSEACNEVMKREGLKDYDELQSYFIGRMANYLHGKNKNIIGWDEILEGGLADDAVVMSWRGEAGGIEAAEMNHPVIMTPNRYCYFDFRQTKKEKQRVFWYKYSPVSNTYGYEPVPSLLSSDKHRFVLGSQGNVWTEYLETPEEVEFFILPRMSALAEVLWSERGKKDFDDFKKRLEIHFQRLSALKANYCNKIE